MANWKIKRALFLNYFVFAILLNSVGTVILLNKIGHIPNGNRAYYVGRSQPPFFSLMVKVLSEERGKNILIKYLPELEKEYQFWMKGSEILNETEIPTQSGLKWDAPNGWAPLQWMAFKGLQNYGFMDLANKVKTHWLNANIKIYERTVKMTEKYNVFDQNLEAGGGEYPLQDGFGWTNGVFLALGNAE